MEDKIDLNISLTFKEICDLLDKEAEYYYDKRKCLTDPKEILHENYYNRFSNYAECCKNLKGDFLSYILNK